MEGLTMLDFFIKAAIIMLLIIPLVFLCILFVILAEYLMIQDRQKESEVEQK